MIKNNFNDLALAILRIGFSVMLLTHSIPKIGRLFADTIEFPDPLGVGATMSLILATIAEVVGSVLVIIGYKTKLAAILPMIVMIVALLGIHFNDPIGTKEKAILFLLAYLTVFLAGPGKYSIDGMKK